MKTYNKQHEFGIITDLDKESRYDLLVFAVVPGDSVHRFRNIFQNKVQIDFILLYKTQYRERMCN